MEYVSFVILHYKDYSVTGYLCQVYIGNGTAGTYPDCDRRQRHSGKKKKTDRNCSKNIRGIPESRFCR